MDDEKIYKAAKLEYHIALDSDKTKDFAFDCAIIEAIKQARADEREKIMKGLDKMMVEVRELVGNKGYNLLNYNDIMKMIKKKED